MSPGRYYQDAGIRAAFEQYAIHHDGELAPERIRGVLHANVAGKKLTDLHTGAEVCMNL